MAIINRGKEGREFHEWMKKQLEKKRQIKNLQERQRKAAETSRRRQYERQKKAMEYEERQRKARERIEAEERVVVEWPEIFKRKMEAARKEVRDRRIAAEERRIAAEEGRRYIDREAEEAIRRMGAAQPSAGPSRKPAQPAGRQSRNVGKRVGGVLGWFWRGGRSERDYGRYRAERTKYSGKLGAEKRFSRYEQHWWLKFILLLLFAFVGWYYLEYSFWVLFTLVLIIVVFSLWFNLKIALVFSVIVIIFFGTSIGGMVRTEAKPYFEEAWITVLTFGKSIYSRAMGVGEWRNPYVTEVKEKKGIKLDKVRPIQSAFLSGDEISIFGSGKVRALEETSTIRFGCSMDGKEGTIEKDKETLTVFANQDTTFGIKCNLGKVDVGTTEYKNVKFSAIYNNFKTEAKLRLYLMDKEKKDELEGRDPFEGVIDRSLDKKDRTTTSEYKFAPIKVSLFVSTSQPLSEGTYTLMIGVDNDKLRWEDGELAKFKYETNVEDWFEWWSVGKWFVEGAVEEIKKTMPSGMLKLKFFGGLEPLEGKCKNIYLLKAEDSQIFYCDFKVEDVKEDDLSIAEIRAVAVYDYEFSKEGSVTITPREA